MLTRLPCLAPITSAVVPSYSNLRHAFRSTRIIVLLGPFFFPLSSVFSFCVCISRAWSKACDVLGTLSSGRATRGYLFLTRLITPSMSSTLTNVTDRDRAESLFFPEPPVVKTGLEVAQGFPF